MNAKPHCWTLVALDGIRVFPSLANELGGANDKAWAGLKAFSKPLLTIWASASWAAPGSARSNPAV